VRSTQVGLSEHCRIWWSDCLVLGGGYILSELTVKCLIGFGRFLRILEDHWKWENGTIISNVQHNRVLSRPEDCLFLCRPRGLQYLVIWILVFLATLSDLNSRLFVKSVLWALCLLWESLLHRQCPYYFTLFLDLFYKGNCGETCTVGDQYQFSTLTPHHVKLYYSRKHPTTMCMITDFCGKEETTI